LVILVGCGQGGGADTARDSAESGDPAGETLPQDRGDEPPSGQPAAPASPEELEQLPPSFERDVNLGNAWMAMGDADRAAAAFESAAALAPNDSLAFEARIAAGNSFFQVGRLEEALLRYEAATELRPEDPNGYNFVGITAGRLGRHDEALEALRTALKVDPFHLPTHVNLGNLYFREGDIEGAILRYQSAVNIDTTDAGSWYNLALAYEQSENPNHMNLAILAYNKVIECDDADPRPWERLGWIYAGRRFYSAARERWREAVKRDPSRTDLIEQIETLEAYAESTGTR
jgi:tetratricopeptide (TPR) repeat protein